MLDQDALRFQAKVMAIAKRRVSVKCEGEDAEAFLDLLYEDYKAAGSPKHVEEWIEWRLRAEFVSVGEPPQWVEPEPTWPFFEGKPMVFICQTYLPQNRVTEERLTWDTMVYLFGARRKQPEGYEMHYRTVEQHPDMPAVFGQPL